MAHAFCGDWESPCLTRMMGSRSLWHNHAAGWATKMYSRVRARLGVVEGAALHLWHGELSSRQHVRRHEALRRLNFDPDRDIKTGEDGCWRWASDKPSLHDALVGYLSSRRQETEKIRQ